MPIIVGATGPSKTWVRLEALSDDVVRVWYSASAELARKPSIAMEAAPKSRIPLREDDRDGKVFVRTAKLLLEINQENLAISVFDAKTKRLIVAPLNLPEIRPDGRWILTEGLAPEEHILGLGEDNRNHGKLDRRGTIRELWAGQQIQSGNVTAESPNGLDRR